VGCSDPQQHAEDLEAQVLLVAEAIRPALDEAHLVVESLDEAKGDLVLSGTVARDAVPVTSIISANSS
jgi:hypothetical protein